jgi:hypothetical protein
MLVEHVHMEDALSDSVRAAARLAAYAAVVVIASP